MLVDIARESWPSGSLVGRVVSGFNTSHEEDVPFLHLGKRYTCWIKWGAFAQVRGGKGMIESVADCAPYLPSNHGGIVIAQSTEVIMAVFDHDGTYYLQTGEVVRIARSDKPRRGDELAEKYHAMYDGQLQVALAEVVRDKSADAAIADLCLREEFAARSQMPLFYEARKRVLNNMSFINRAKALGHDPRRASCAGTSTAC